jgi:hypothetical protein
VRKHILTLLLLVLRHSKYRPKQSNIMRIHYSRQFVREIVDKAKSVYNSVMLNSRANNPRRIWYISK